MKVYCVKYTQHAGRWIYDGYRSAWKEKGYDLHERISKDWDKFQGTGETAYASPYPADEESMSEDYMLMTTADLAAYPDYIKAISRSKKTFLFVQPNVYPDPWGRHANFYCTADKDYIKELDQMDNVRLWTFADVVPEYYTQWTKEIHTVPLAFDSVNYQPKVEDKYKKFDISFVGGWANNGFNEKRKIIIDIFSKFKESGLTCGFFINKNLTRQQECDLLANSRMTLNIHDAYQRVLGLDTNERTYKSLGLNGMMVSDTVGQLNNLFPDIKTSLDSQQLVELTKNVLSLTETELNDIKEKNKQNILDNHCYTNRVEELLNL